MNRLRKSFADLFDLYLGESTVQIVKQRLSVFYEPLYQELLQETIRKAVIHIDETTVRMRKVNGYVWVLTSMDMVYYFYKPSREAAFLRELLNPFNGVLVSDFYAGYDALPCQQQKCLVHLVRDIDDDLLRNPLDEELKLLARSFGSLLRTIIATVDLFGLKRRHLNKHRKDVGRFLKTVETTSYSSALAKAYAKRFEKHGPKMFTFLNHDGVPWNNNNAEHAIKRFVKFRRETDGRYTESTLKQYLILASVLETCEFNNVNPLKFLLSKENTLGGLLRMAGRKIKNTVSSSAPATVESANQDEQCRER